MIHVKGCDRTLDMASSISNTSNNPKVPRKTHKIMFFLTSSRTRSANTLKSSNIVGGITWTAKAEGEKSGASHGYLGTGGTGTDTKNPPLLVDVKKLVLKRSGSEIVLPEEAFHRSNSGIRS